MLCFVFVFSRRFLIGHSSCVNMTVLLAVNNYNKDNLTRFQVACLPCLSNFLNWWLDCERQGRSRKIISQMKKKERCKENHSNWFLCKNCLIRLHVGMKPKCNRVFYQNQKWRKRKNWHTLTVCSRDSSAWRTRSFSCLIVTSVNEKKRSICKIDGWKILLSI